MTTRPLPRRVLAEDGAVGDGGDGLGIAPDDDGGRVPPVAMASAP